MAKAIAISGMEGKVALAHGLGKGRNVSCETAHHHAFSCCLQGFALAGGNEGALPSPSCLSREGGQAGSGRQRASGPRSEACGVLLTDSAFMADRALAAETDDRGDMALTCAASWALVSEPKANGEEGVTGFLRSGEMRTPVQAWDESLSPSPLWRGALVEGAPGPKGATSVAAAGKKAIFPLPLVPEHWRQSAMPPEGGEPWRTYGDGEKDARSTAMVTVSSMPADPRSRVRGGGVRAASQMAWEGEVAASIEKSVAEEKPSTSASAVACAKAAGEEMAAVRDETRTGETRAGGNGEIGNAGTREKTAKGSGAAAKAGHFSGSGASTGAYAESKGVGRMSASTAVARALQHADLDMAAGMLEVRDRIVVSARMVNRGETVKAQIKLQPESLGKLELEVECSGGVTVRLTVQNRAALEVMQRELPQLRAALTSVGLELDGLHLGMEGGGSALQERTARHESPHWRRQEGETTVTIHAYRPEHQGILDIEA